MCDCAPLIPMPYEFGGGVQKLAVTRFNSKGRRTRNELPGKVLIGRNSKPRSCRNEQLSGKDSVAIFQKHAISSDLSNHLGFSNFGAGGKVSSSVGVNRNYGELRPDGNESLDQIVIGSLNEKQGEAESACSDPAMTARLEEEQRSAGSSDPTTFDFLELKRELEKGERVRQGPGSLEEEEEEEDVLLEEGSTRAVLESGEEEVVVGSFDGSRALKSRRQMLRRSSLLAKQVISMQSACSLGFISQLWVNTRSWVVVVVEVRPSLFSGEMEKILLEDVCQVGDVVLVQNESVIANELKMIGLDTLVGTSPFMLVSMSIQECSDCILLDLLVASLRNTVKSRTLETLP